MLGSQFSRPEQGFGVGRLKTTNCIIVTRRDSNPITKTNKNNAEKNLSLAESFFAEPPIIPNGIPTIKHPTVTPKAIEFHTLECYSFFEYLLEIFLDELNEIPDKY